MTTEEEILKSLEICNNLPNYDDFEQVVSDIHELTNQLLPEESMKPSESEEKNDKEDKIAVTEETETIQSSIPVATSSANVKYDEVTRPIPTVKGVPIVSPPVEQLEKSEEKSNEEDVPSQPEDIYDEVKSEPDDADAAPVKTVPALKTEDLYKTKEETSEEEKSEEDSSEETEVEIDKKKEVIKGIIAVVICVVAALGISFFITRFVAYHTQVEGSSMEKSLHDGDEIIVEKVSYYFNDPERYDIIIFPYKKDEFYIKRIIGLPGEMVQIKNGKVYIDGVQLWEQYGNEDIEDAGRFKEEIVLGKDEYFVLGDNRNASKDSRSNDVGVVKRNTIMGKAWLRFYPFSDFGFIKH